MPSYITKRGKRRVKAHVMVQGKTREKLFPDDSKKSYRSAVKWEEEAREQIAKEVEEEQTKTHTASCPDLLEWATAYLADAEDRLSVKTFREKRYSFKRLSSFQHPKTLTEDLIPSIALKFLQEQSRTRSGYAANKDRKNLSVAWDWGRKFLPEFPSENLNPFSVVDRFPEKRQPRYIPPEEDYWEVMAVVQGQDKVMLRAFLHLAARRSEIFNMTWEDVSFGGEQIRLWTCKRKNGTQEYDWLPMTKELKADLLWWWENRPFKRAQNVFVQTFDSHSSSHNPGHPFKERRWFMSRMCKKAGVPPFGFHAIRHLSATCLYHAGYDLAVIQAILRHKSPNTTARYLKRLGLDNLKLDDSVFGGPKGKVLTMRTAMGNDE